MKREFSPIHLALLLILSCVVFRLISSVFPEYIPNISPLMAIAFVGAMYLPGRWGWLVGPATLILTDLAFLNVNYRTEGAMFSWWSLVSLGIYALAGGLGVWIASRKSLVKIIGGSIVCSLLFYVAANTFSWWNNLAMKMIPAYPPTLAGWWQANTVGLAGYTPTWLFLRNGIAGDLFFVLLLLLILDRGLLWGQVPTQAAQRAV
jgi:hypothetical protein